MSYKTRRGHRGRVREGRNPGSCPYGFEACNDFDPVAKKKVTGVLLRVEHEIKVIERIFHMFADGWSPNAIARALNEEGITSPNGGSWRGERVRKITQNETYIGKRVYNKTRNFKDPMTGRTGRHKNPESEWIHYEDDNLKIIGDNLWKSVQARWEDIHNNETYQAISNKLTGMRRAKHLLSGLLYCGECGSTYTVASKKRYGCSNFKRKEGCTNGKTITQPVIDNHVLDFFRNDLLADDKVKHFLDKYRGYCEELIEDHEQANNITRKKITGLEQKIDSLIEAAERGMYSETMEKRIKEYEAQKKEAEGQIITIPPIELPDDNILEEFRDMIDDLSANLDDTELRHKVMNAIRPMINSITLYPAEGGLNGDLKGTLHDIAGLQKNDDSFFIRSQISRQHRPETPRYLSPFMVTIFMPHWEGNRKK